MDFIRLHQQNAMLFLSGTCFVLSLLSFFSKTLGTKRRLTLMGMEFVAGMLLIMDRFAYIYRGNVSQTGWWMVRISNFSVFLFSLCILHTYTVYLMDLYTHEGGLTRAPRKLRIADVVFVFGVIMLIISQFAGLYYTFDDTNHYHRGRFHILGYMIPGICAALQFSTILQHRKRIKPAILIPILLFNIVPIIATVIQFFNYGISCQSIALVGEVIMLYIFVLVDMNNTVEHANKLEIEFLKNEQKHVQLMFEQTATALANAIDAKDEYTHGHSMRVAEYARKIAKIAGKTEKECTDVYFAGLLHDVGKIGISDAIITKSDRLTDKEFDAIKMHPVIGKQILASISQSPYISIAANYHHERYDGRGYPERMKGTDIPEIARIIAVADSYDAMTSKRSYRDPIPQEKVREEIIKGMGTQFDPEFARIMIYLIDRDTDYQLKERYSVKGTPGTYAFDCTRYRSICSEGILLGKNIAKIHLHFKAEWGVDLKDSYPAFILFDAIDGRLHAEDDEGVKQELLYTEYAEIRFDGKVNGKEVRNVQADVMHKADFTIEDARNGIDYAGEAVRCKDHVLIRIFNAFQEVQIIIALPDSSRFAYLSLTGSHCHFSQIEITESDFTVSDDYIPRIAKEISFIDSPHGDIRNLQIDGWRSAATEGIPVKEGLTTIKFHTKSLPTARLIWHCPYLSLFCSDDSKVNGENFKEFILIRFDGENWDDGIWAKNTMLLSKNSNFEGWESWKKKNKAGFDCEIAILRKGNVITVTTENLGIAIKSITKLTSSSPAVYAALTGDQCALTNIRICHDSHGLQ